jgi:dihydrofolate reductase / thymidylate synthase
MFNIIVGIDQKRGIAKNGKLPWPHSKIDMHHFVETTTGELEDGRFNAVIMGRKTWESIDAKYRPLKNRVNIILSRTLQIQGENTFTFGDFEDALRFLNAQPKLNEIFVIGGQEIYEIAVNDPKCKRIITTMFPNDYDCDKHFPEIPVWFNHDHSDVHDELTMNYYDSRLNLQSSEYEYLNVLGLILNHGTPINDRTGVGTLACFSAHMTFPIEVVNPEASQKNLQYRVPIMTTKTLFHRGVFEELIFFLQGKTNVKQLQEKKVRIWDGNTSREYLDKHELQDYAEGETGPFYGFQWNYFGADYLGADEHAEHAADPNGVNQLERCIHLLKTDPYSRRIVLSAWNPKDLPQMCLPPCHMVYNFCVIPPSDEEEANGQTKPRLHCAMFQRSGDMFLGVPFNIYSTTLLTILMSRAANMLPGSISLTITNAHIYKNHIEQVKTQLERVPYNYPILQLKKTINGLEDMRNLDFKKHYVLSEYHKHPAIKAEMAI